MMDPDSISISDLSVADASVMLAKLACVTRMLKQAAGPAPDPSIMGTLKGWGSDIANNWTTPSKLIDNPLAMAGGGAAAGGLLGAGSSMLNDEEDQHPFRNAITGALAGGLGGLGMQQALHYGGKVQDSIQHPETNPDGTETLGAGRGKYDASVAKRDSLMTYKDKAINAAKNFVGYGVGVKGIRAFDPELRSAANPLNALNRQDRITDPRMLQTAAGLELGETHPTYLDMKASQPYTRAAVMSLRSNAAPAGAGSGWLNRIFNPERPMTMDPSGRLLGGSMVDQGYLDKLQSTEPDQYKALVEGLTKGKIGPTRGSAPAGLIPQPSEIADHMAKLNYRPSGFTPSPSQADVDLGNQNRSQRVEAAINEAVRTRFGTPVSPHLYDLLNNELGGEMGPDVAERIRQLRKSQIGKPVSNIPGVKQLGLDKLLDVISKRNPAFTDDKPVLDTARNQKAVDTHSKLNELLQKGQQRFEGEYPGELEKMRQLYSGSGTEGSRWVDPVTAYTAPALTHDTFSTMKPGTPLANAAAKLFGATNRNNIRSSAKSTYLPGWGARPPGSATSESSSWWERANEAARKANQVIGENDEAFKSPGYGAGGKALNWGIAAAMGLRAFNNTPRTKDYADAVQEIIKQRAAASPSLLDYINKHPGNE
jgi:hypothetical protein